MSTHHPSTLGYFSAPSGHLWEWRADDDHAFIVWHGDADEILVYREELESLLKACMPDGLPPLGALLLATAAAQQHYSASQTRIRLWEASQRATGDREVSMGIAELWKRVGAGLDHIHALPAALRANGPARCHLLRTLFPRTAEDGASHVDPSQARLILTEFKQTPYLDLFQQRTPELNGVARLLADLSALEKAFRSCPPEHLEQRLLTGLDHLPMRQLELQLPPRDETPAPDAQHGPPDLLRALEQEGGELAQIGGLVRRMTAILHVPKAVAQREEMPLGGVSDITNRGDPSRLLMTELAWDDLTFAVRLAQGEALYLRRESPPAEPPPRRLVLIDTGIFMWGKPRLFALGAALALLRQKQGSQAISGRVMTANGTVFTPITLDTVDDVRAQLKLLHPTPHPGVAVNELMERQQDGFESAEDVFLITHPSALEQLALLPAWQRLATSVLLHTLLVDRDGALQLSRHSLAGTKPLAQARVDATDLFDPPQPSPLTLTGELGRLPLFYQQSPWPLYHAGPPAQGKAVQMGGRGFIGLSTTGCVCWWTLRVTAARIISPTTPSQNIYGITVDPNDDDCVILVFQSDNVSIAHFLVASLEGRHDARWLSCHVNLKDLEDIRIESGALTLLDHNEYKAFDLTTSLQIASTLAKTSQGRPWFDGETFRPEGKNSADLRKITSSKPDIRAGHKWKRITEVTSVGFGVTGGLFLQMDKGRRYQLVIQNEGRLSWIASQNAAALMPLRPLGLGPTASDSRGLLQADFPDGRRIVFDPCGFLHVCDGRDDPQELSIVLVKGSTAAWQRKGFYYGDTSLFWTESVGAKTVLESLTRSLFRRLDPSHPIPSPSVSSRLKTHL